MEFQCEGYEDSGYYTCNVVKIVKNSSAFNGILFTGNHLQGKTNADVRRFRIVNQPLDAFPRNLHERFPNLKALYIEACGLEKISKTDLIGLENLEVLNLGGNKLTYLPDDLFADMRKLGCISFRDNKLESFSSKLLEPIETLLERAFFTRNTRINDIFFKRGANRSLKRLMDIMDSIEPLPSKPDNQYQQMLSKFAELRASGELTDFTIKVRGKEFKVHKAVLAVQSPVFRQTFTNDDGTTEKTFTKVKNFSQESFGSFLDFFYTGKVGDDVNALEVFELATVFEVAILKEICADKISAALSPTNALEIFNLAHHHNSDELKRKAFKIIQKMFPEFPDKFVDNPEQVTHLVTVKREYDAMLEATKKL